MKKLLPLFLLLLPGLMPAQGMWLPSLIEKQNEKEMRSMGLKLEADDLYHPSNASVKDAICMFGGGCTGEMISPEGLLLTNHHCGFGAIQQLSTLESNYVEDGYWAKDRSSELPAPGITAMFIVRMEDVTTLALQQVTEGMSERDRQSQIDKNIAQIKANTKKEKWEEISVRPFYNGNQYYLYVTQTFKDVRFVGAPPAVSGSSVPTPTTGYGPVTPATFPFSGFMPIRSDIPPTYSVKNLPYRPRHFLPIAIEGAAEGDFTMVYGFPGRTDEYLTEAAVRQIGEVLDPQEGGVIRDRVLKVLDGYMRKYPLSKFPILPSMRESPTAGKNGWVKCRV
jgi:hypothetical protein